MSRRLALRVAAVAVSAAVPLLACSGEFSAGPADAGAAGGAVGGAGGAPEAGGPSGGSSPGGASAGGTSSGGTAAGGTGASGTGASGTGASGTGASGTGASGTGAGGTSAGGTSAGGTSSGGAGPADASVTTPEAGTGGGGPTKDVVDPPPPPCGVTLGGEMALIETSAGDRYCIDRFEVTNHNYGAFLAAAPGAFPGLPDVCAYKLDHTPSVWPAERDGEHPVVNVDQCDAQAFCLHAGKRLCGKIGGGPNPYADYGATTAQWFHVCSSGGEYRYPYGDAYDARTCVGVEYDGVGGFQPAGDHPWPPGTARACHPPAPPFDAVYDLAGNVAEWEDSCNGKLGAADGCHVRGDSYREGVEITTACVYAPRLSRSTRAGYLGFRCCRDL